MNNFPDDKELIYIAGNGAMACVYSDGDIAELFGPPYSSPPLLECRFTDENAIRTPVSHLKRAGIWTMALKDGDAVCASLTDFALPDEACIVRHIESTREVKLRLRPYAGRNDLFQYELPELTEGGADILLKTRGGNYVYNDYPLPFPQFMHVLVRGGAAVERDGEYCYLITVRGTADILFVGGPSYPECETARDRVALLPYKAMLDAAKRRWAEEFAPVTVLDEIPGDFPERERLACAIEDTVINLAVQQAREGGVLAGVPFPLGYVRDQFGICMCMLRLGLYERARRMLGFYISVFRRSGKILNAQGLGVDGLFHFAENDRTEITGYLLLQFFRYAEVTGDRALLADNLDFLLWLYRAQASQVHNGMLPFNGDETYIAGGLLPRDVINEGSAEATLLFVLSAEKLLAYLRERAETDRKTESETEQGTEPETVRKTELPGPEELEAMERTVSAVRADYAANFVINGKYTLNSSARLDGLDEPRFRYGVCMNLGGEGCEFFGWTRRFGDVYVCPKCAAAHRIPQRRKQRFYLPSALLMPAYLGSNLPDRSVVYGTVTELAARFARDGFLYSDEANRKNVGFDYGLLLINCVKYGLPCAEDVYRKILSLVDGAGTWAERYIEDKPDGARYRPWESAINVDAMIQFMREYR